MMSRFGELISDDAVRFERTLPGPIETVWQYLIDEDKRKQWLCGGNTELRNGGNVEMHFHNASLSKHEDIDPPEKYGDMPKQVEFSGTVTAYDPPKRLSHTWDFEGESSEVTYELSEVGDEVILVLTHRRLASTEEKISVCGGWHTHLDILQDVMNNKDPKPFWTQHTTIEGVYEDRLSQ